VGEVGAEGKAVGGQGRDGGEEVGSRGAHCRVQDAPEGPSEVAGRERRAVAEAKPTANGEGIGSAVARDFRKTRGGIRKYGVPLGRGASAKLIRVAHVPYSIAHARALVPSAGSSESTSVTAATRSVPPREAFVPRARSTPRLNEIPSRSPTKATAERRVRRRKSVGLPRRRAEAFS